MAFLAWAVKRGRERINGSFGMEDTPYIHNQFGAISADGMPSASGLYSGTGDTQVEPVCGEGATARTL